jgi:hypothetical protein
MARGVGMGWLWVWDGFCQWLHNSEVELDQIMPMTGLCQSITFLFQANIAIDFDKSCSITTIVVFILGKKCLNEIKHD